MYIYNNGEYLLENEVRISPFDHGFLYGLGVFETFRIDEGHPFLLDDHFYRLQNSLGELNIKVKMEKEEWRVIVSELLVRNHLKSAYIRFNVSAGVAPIGLQTNEYLEPNVIVFIKSLPSPLAKTKKALFLEQQRNTPEGSQRLKSHHYLNNVLGKREAPGLDQEGIFLTHSGYVAEGVVSNIFWVKDGHVFTPSVETGILNGITRQLIIQLLNDHHIPCHEGFFYPSEVIEADEVFVTNSIQEIVSITALNDHQYLAKKDITAFLIELYNRNKARRLWSMEERIRPNGNEL